MMLAEAGATIGIECLTLDPAPGLAGLSVAPAIVGAYDDEGSLAELAAASRRRDLRVRERPRGVGAVPGRAGRRRPAARVARVRTGPAPREDPVRRCRPRGPAVRAGRRRGGARRGARRRGCAIDPQERGASATTGRVRCGSRPSTPRGTRGDRSARCRRSSSPSSRSIASSRSWARVGATAPVAFYPLVENVHRDGILRVSTAPAGDVSPRLQAEAERLALDVMERLGHVGVLAIELFQVDDGSWATSSRPACTTPGTGRSRARRRRSSRTTSGPSAASRSARPPQRPTARWST